jgi:hypothetical protein
MIFITVFPKAPMFGIGKQLSKDRFEIMKGIKMFFYDSDSLQRDFGKYGLIELSEIIEPNKNMENKPPLIFTTVKCKKKVNDNLKLPKNFRKFFVFYNI